MFLAQQLTCDELCCLEATGETQPRREGQISQCRSFGCYIFHTYQLWQNLWQKWVKMGEFYLLCGKLGALFTNALSDWPVMAICSRPLNSLFYHSVPTIKHRTIFSFRKVTSVEMKLELFRPYFRPHLHICVKKLNFLSAILWILPLGKASNAAGFWFTKPFN